MTITVQAIYEGGVLRPVQPLPLTEGETVELTVNREEQGRPTMRPPTAEEADYARRMKAAKSLEEVIATTTTAPPLPPGYDLCQALNANRNATGERPPLPDAEDDPRP